MAKPQAIQEQATRRFERIRATEPLPLGKPSADFPDHVVLVLAQLPQDRSLFNVVEAVINEAVDYSFGIDQVIKILRTNGDIQGTLLTDLHTTVHSVFPKPETPNEDFSPELIAKTIDRVSHYFLVPSDSTTLHATLTAFKSELPDSEFQKVCTLVNSTRFTDMLMHWFNTLMERMAQHAFKVRVSNPEAAQGYFSSFVKQLVNANGNGSNDAVLRGFMEVFADAISHDVKPELIDGLIQHARREKKGVTAIDRIMHGTRAEVSTALSEESKGYLNFASRAVTDASIKAITYLQNVEGLIDDGDMDIVRNTGSLSTIMIELIKGADKLTPERATALGKRLVAKYCETATTDELRGEFYLPRKRTAPTGRFEAMKSH